MRTRTITRPEPVPYPVPAYKPVPKAYTDPLAVPPQPAAHCTLHGQPAVCVLDALVWAGKLLDVVTTANADRADVARLTQAKGDDTP